MKPNEFDRLIIEIVHDLITKYGDILRIRPESKEGAYVIELSDPDPEDD